MLALPKLDTRLRVAIKAANKIKPRGKPKAHEVRAAFRRSLLVSGQSAKEGANKRRGAVSAAVGGSESCRPAECRKKSEAGCGGRDRNKPPLGPAKERKFGGWRA